MPSKTLTLSNAMLNRAADAIGARYNYEPLLLDGSTNPETKEQFFWRWWFDRMKQEVRAQELETLRAAVVVSDIVIT